MYFLQLLPFASLALAIPSQDSNTKRQTSCTSQAWEIEDYHTCTNCTYPGATQETTSLVFKFVDPNFDPVVTTTCERDVSPGSSLIDFNYTPCGSGVAFYYDGDDLNVERTGVECEGHTYTFSGGVGITGLTFCYSSFGGTYCETPTGEVNVPISFIQQTSAK